MIATRKRLTELSHPQKNIMVTVREVNLLITRASYLVAMAVNTALNPTFSEDEFARLV